MVVIVPKQMEELTMGGLLLYPSRWKNSPSDGCYCTQANGRTHHRMVAIVPKQLEELAIGWLLLYPSRRTNLPLDDSYCTQAVVQQEKNCFSHPIPKNLQEDEWICLLVLIFHISQEFHMPGPLYYWTCQVALN
ncbi:hypothetical protein XELAEV_18011437mg [Xenopus laevis]|uniref:Uncharacterized protein n=1 Tax=Xenopus laevis TaxID=8355 RepID=A0A974HXS5_XENLA|nr:hypothetical protein XELAEV_18011437mg [Xenopus laevis]